MCNKKNAILKFNKIILQLKIKKKIRMNSKPIKTEVGPKSLSYDEIYNLIINFNTEIDNYTEQIESPKAGNVYLRLFIRQKQCCV
jgi:hypothetical protein